MEVYVQYLHDQVRELLTDYGKIDYMWFDFSYPDRDWGWSKGKGALDWKSEELEKLVLDLQPQIILNNRLNLNRGVYTPEQYQPKEALTYNGEEIIWEACQTLNGSWGYHRDQRHWKSSEMIIKMLVDTVSKNGNLLLNVGPTGRGEFEQQAVDILSDLNGWMHYHAQAIYGASASKFQAPVDCRLTQRGNKLYVHMFSYPYRTLHVEHLAGKVAYAQFLHDHSEVTYQEFKEVDVLHHDVPVIEPGEVVFNMPVLKPDVVVPVLEITLKDE